MRRLLQIGSLAVLGAAVALIPPPAAEAAQAAMAWQRGQQRGRPPGPPPGMQDRDHRPPGPGKRHGGAWLRKYHSLPPEQQERALEQDPRFQQLRPEQQERLKERLRRFNQLPPEQQRRILERMDRFSHLSPQEQQRARELFHQMRDLPGERREVVRGAFRRLREMGPEDRRREMDSDQFRQQFSEEERSLLREALELGTKRGVPEDKAEEPDE